MMAPRPLRRFGLLSLLLLALVAPTACSKQAVPLTQDAALAITPDFLDLGAVTFGERATGTFRIENTGDKAQNITRIGPFSCSCASAELRLPGRQGAEASRRLDGGRLALTLAPGEVAEVVFTLDTSRYRQPTSRKVGSVPVVLSEGPGLTLQWGADIWTPFQVEPWMTDFGEVGLRERPSGFVLVVSHDTYDFSVDVDTEVDGWVVKSQKVSDPDSVRRSYQLTFTAPPELPEGPFRKDFLFHTNLQGAPPIKFAVQGRAVPNLFVSPTRVMFDPDRGRSHAEIHVVQRAAGKPLGTVSLGELPAGLEFLGEETLDPQRKVLRFAWTGEAPEESLHQDLLIRTDEEEQPEIRVPLSVLKRRQDP